MAQIPALGAAQWQEDLQYLVDELTAHHLNLFHTITPDQFTQVVAEIRASVPLLEDAAIVVELIRLAALIGDGHTSFRSWELFKRYPLDLFWFGNQLRVVRTTSNYARALGTQVVQIGDSDINDALAAVEAIIQQGENEWFVRQRTPFFLTAAEILHHLNIVSSTDHARYTFRDQGRRPNEQTYIDNERLFTLDLVPISQDEPMEWIDASDTLPYYRQRPEEAFWFIRLAGGRTVYVCFRRYDSFEENAHRLRAFIDATPTDRLIIDMRQNGGGDLTKMRQHLIPAIKAHPRINQPGHLFVIIGRQTYSAAMSNATDLRKETYGILVGEPTGARPNGYQETYRFVLPNSHLAFSCSTRFYRFQDEDTPAVIPDKRIEPSWDAYQKGLDPVLEWILE